MCLVVGEVKENVKYFKKLLKQAESMAKVYEKLLKKEKVKVESCKYALRVLEEEKRSLPKE